MRRKIQDKVIKVPNSAVFNNSYIFIVEESRIKKIDIVILNEEQDGVLIQNNNINTAIDFAQECSSKVVAKRGVVTIWLYM